MKNFKDFTISFIDIMNKNNLRHYLNFFQSIRKELDFIKSDNKYQIWKDHIFYVDIIDIQGFDDFDDDFKTNMLHKTSVIF